MLSRANVSTRRITFFVLLIDPLSVATFGIILLLELAALNKLTFMKRILFFLLICSNQMLFAQSGSLDQSFGVSGVALGPYISQYSYAYGIAQQQDGKIVVTGYLEDNGLHTFITRYDTNGIVDPTFSNPILTIGQLGDYGRAIAVQPDGKILVAGFADNATSDIFLVRRLPSGDADTTFGINGVVITDFGTSTIDHAHDMVLQPDGKILVAGWALQNDIDIALLRYNSDGSIDSSFGTNGRVSTDIDNSIQEGNAVALQPDGKILVAGLTISTLGFNNLSVFRYHADGSPDSTFGVNGISIPPVNIDDNAANDMALQSDGKIVLAGYTFTIIPYGDVLVVRLDTLGNPDPSFGGTGVVSMNSTFHDNFATGVLIQSDGKIITTGRAYNTTSDFQLARFYSDGQIDSAFGTDGHVHTSIGLEEDFIYASLLQQDGKIVVAGYYTDSGIENFAVARYRNNSPSTTSVNENIQDGFMIYPQPAVDVLYITYDNSETKIENVDVSVFNLTGEKLLSQEYPSVISHGQTIAVDCKSLNSGIYILQINSGAGVLWKKFLKE
jgi:uncharacterized delta-60 repeat protein